MRLENGKEKLFITSNLVELRGFEPLASSMPWKRSSQLS